MPRVLVVVAVALIAIACGRVSAWDLLNRISHKYEVVRVDTSDLFFKHPVKRMHMIEPNAAVASICMCVSVCCADRLRRSILCGLWCGGVVVWCRQPARFCLVRMRCTRME